MRNRMFIMRKVKPDNKVLLFKQQNIMRAVAQRFRMKALLLLWISVDKSPKWIPDPLFSS
ncbi:hypothetical protein EMIT091MI3_20133 [Kosakonia quasisacchari]